MSTGVEIEKAADLAAFSLWGKAHGRLVDGKFNKVLVTESFVSDGTL